MKEQLKKADLLGLAIVAAAVISYSVRGIWNVYQTIAAVVGVTGRSPNHPTKPPTLRVSAAQNPKPG